MLGKGFADVVIVDLDAGGKATHRRIRAALQERETVARRRAPFTDHVHARV
jgi:hypothetical protein